VISPFHERVLAVLRESLSSINAQALLNGALANARLSPATLQPRHMGALMAVLTPGLRTFLGDAGTRRVLGELRALQPQSDATTTSRVELRDEDDLVGARLAAREQCVALGVDSFALQRVLTVVSELSRNIVAYSRGGHIEISADGEVVTVRAVDLGPGIRDLEQILAGRYRSRTGLGLGILGVKRLSKDIDIQTGPEGTTVVAKVAIT
jgi:serine/threonine-protein kinase RsbT